MSQPDRDKWDKRYSEGSYLERVHPTQLLADWLPRLPGGRALDVACGAGRNALYLAEAGYEVDAIDISPVALERAAQTAAERGVEVNWLQSDLDENTLPTGSYDVIVMVRYVNHGLIPKLLDLLTGDGRFICEEHLVTTEDVAGPGNPAFRLQPGELRELASNMRVLYYREGLVEDPDGRRAALAQLVAHR